MAYRVDKYPGLGGNQRAGRHQGINADLRRATPVGQHADQFPALHRLANHPPLQQCDPGCPNNRRQQRFTDIGGEGFRIVLSSRNKNYVAAQADQLRAAGLAAEGRVADASDITSIVELIREVEVETGGVDVLHFNAAAMHDGNLETQSVAGFIQDLTTNVGAVYAAIKAVTPLMAARGAGAILLTGGMFATQPHPEYLTLSVGKAGLLNLTHALFPLLKAQNIHLSIVTVGAYVKPGSVEVREIAELFWQQYRQPSAQWTAEVFYPAPHNQ